jgi:hypothetical protein
MNVTNPGNIKIQKITAGTTARVGTIVRAEVTARAKITHRIGKIRETKKTCATRHTTR